MSLIPINFSRLGDAQDLKIFMLMTLAEIVRKGKHKMALPQLVQRSECKGALFWEEHEAPVGLHEGY